ncbi:hypothetical protein EDD85DRAFT_1025914 [Armillaria nabsnona]|nr:hypothetical protein EDD85DRAFT_1025914 [Armillaria nabsnona]
MYEAGVRRTQELSGVSLAKQNGMTGDSDSPKINEEMRHPTLESLQTKPKDLNDSRFWAVLIGVDGDPHHPLHGYVSDAEPMEKYLIEDLDIPSNRIQRLLGPTREETIDGYISPTRANILKTSYSLIDNTDILPGDSITVYFTGNGGCYDAEEYYRNRVPPEFSLASITMHCVLRPRRSGRQRQRATRSSSIADARVRELEVFLRSEHPHPFRNVSPLLRHAIEHMLERVYHRLATYPQYLAGCSVAAYDWQPETRCHVILAAFRKTSMRAKKRTTVDDETIHGVFTKSLVDSLGSGQVSTYVDLLAGLPKCPD